MLQPSSRRLAALHAASFLGIGVFVPFFPVWLAGRALGPVEIGIVLTIPIVVRVFVVAGLMGLTETGFGARGLLATSHLALVCLFAALGFAEGVWQIGILVALVAVAQCSLIPANDLVTLDAVRQQTSLAYGGIRVWGSISFLAANIAAGVAVGAVGAGAVIWLLAAVPVLGLLATLAAVPAGRRRHEGGTSASPAGRLPRALWLALAASALIQATHAAIYAFGSIHWRALGFPDAVIGLLWATGVFAEILVFAALGARAGRRAAAGLLALGAIGAMVRFAVLSGDPGLEITFLCQALHGLSFGATHLGLIAAIGALAPPEARARAQGASGTLVALATVGSTLVSGLLYPVAQGGLYLAMVPVAGAGLVLAILAGRAGPQPQRAGAGG